MVSFPHDNNCRYARLAFLAMSRPGCSRCWTSTQETKLMMSVHRFIDMNSWISFCSKTCLKQPSPIGALDRIGCVVLPFEVTLLPRTTDVAFIYACWTLLYQHIICRSMCSMFINSVQKASLKFLILGWTYWTRDEIIHCQYDHQTQNYIASTPITSSMETLCGQFRYMTNSSI